MADEQTNVVENNVETQPTNPETDEKPAQTNPEVTTPEVTKPKLTFSEEQKAWFKEKMQERVNRSHQAFFNRYGVKDLHGLDDLFGKSRQYDELSKKIEELTSQNATLSEQLAFIRNNVNPEKYDDIRRYFKGGNIQLNEGALLEALPTHPEWLNVKPINNPAPVTTIQSLSPNRGDNIGETEKEKMDRIFGKI